MEIPKRAHILTPMTSLDEESLCDPAIYADATRAARAEVYALLIREADRVWHGSADAARNLRSSLYDEIATQCRVVIDQRVVERCVLYYDQHRKPDKQVSPLLGPLAIPA